jgi:4-oxalomesaconate tautomerase
VAFNVASACPFPGSSTQVVARLPQDGRFLIERPFDALEIFLDIGPIGAVLGAASICTAHMLLDGLVFQRDEADCAQR